MNQRQTEYLQLVTNHQALLLGYIRGLAPKIHADDVLQETNIVLWNKIDTFDLNTNFKAFACRVAYLKTMEALKKAKHNQWLVFDSDIVESFDQHHIAKTDDQAETQESLRTCLKKLSASERKLLHQRYTKGHTVRAISAEMNQSEGALQQSFFRIRNTLRNCITLQLSSKP